MNKVGEHGAACVRIPLARGTSETLYGNEQGARDKEGISPWVSDVLKETRELSVSHPGLVRQHTQYITSALGALVPDLVLTSLHTSYGAQGVSARPDPRSAKFFMDLAWESGKIQCMEVHHHISSAACRSNSASNLCSTL